MNAIVVISADTEWRCVRGLYPDAQPGSTPFGECIDLELNCGSIRFYYGGWGKISAAASAQWIIDRHQPDLLVNLGTCGGLRGRIESGATILVERTLVYDLIEQMTDGAAELAYYTTELDLSWLPQALPHPVLRGLMVSGDRDIVVEDIPRLIAEHGAIAADWESAAIAWVARRNGTHTLILRCVSDLVGEDGGEAYGNHGLFYQRTQDIMERLIRELPDWIAAIAQE
jgi:adenosylhomocysteine nucleosidase